MKRLSTYFKNIRKEYNKRKLMKEFNITNFEDDGFTINIDDNNIKVYKEYHCNDEEIDINGNIVRVIPGEVICTVNYNPKYRVMDEHKTYDACMIVSNKFLDLPFYKQKCMLYHEYAHIIFHLMYSHLLENSLTTPMKLYIAHSIVHQVHNDIIDDLSLDELEFTYIKGLSTNKHFDISNARKRSILYDSLIREIENDSRVNKLKHKYTSDNSNMTYQHIYSQHALDRIKGHVSATELEADIFAVNKVDLLTYIISLTSEMITGIKSTYHKFKESFIYDNLAFKIACESSISKFKSDKSKNIIFRLINMILTQCSYHKYKFILLKNITALSISVSEEIKMRIRILVKNHIINKILYSTIK